MSKNSSTNRANLWLPICILALLFVAIPFQSISAASALQHQELHVANDQAQLWFAMVAMGSLLLLGIVWIVWPERRRYVATTE